MFHDRNRRDHAQSTNVKIQLNKCLCPENRSNRAEERIIKRFGSAYPPGRLPRDATGIKLFRKIEIHAIDRTAHKASGRP